MGFVTMGAAAVGVLVFGMIGVLSKRFDERWLLLVAGILPMLLGRAVMLPIPGVDHPPVNCNSPADWAPDFLQDCHDILSPTTTTTTTTTITSTTTVAPMYNLANISGGKQHGPEEISEVFSFYFQNSRRT